MADERTCYFRRLRRLRRSTRRWSVLAGVLGGATAILTPYGGLGLPDALWAASAGGALALTAWRWSDARALAAQPAPPAPDPALAAQRARARVVAAIERLPAGREMMQEVRRQRGRLLLRGSAAADPWSRLDRAAQTLATMSERLTGVAAPAALEAEVAERSLRDLAHRVVGVEKALRFAPEDSRSHLTEVHTGLVGRLTDGVAAYERLVAMIAGYVAEDGRMAADQVSVSRLTEASDLLKGMAMGLAELRTPGQSTRMSN